MRRRYLVPSGDNRLTELQRFNPFLPAEATVEFADEDLDLTNTVLSNTRDQVEGTVLVLGRTAIGDFRKFIPLNHPVQPGAIVRLPPPEDIKTILVGDSKDAHRMHVGTLIGRSDVPASLRTNMVVARHMAILAIRRSHSRVLEPPMLTFAIPMWSPGC